MLRLVLALVLVLGVPAPAAAADWGWPLDGPPPVGRAFAPPEVAYGSGHRGVDLVAPAGSVVRAAGAGVVGYAGLLAGRGVVTVVHGALRTTYEPVTASVAVGDAVALGQPLGVLEAGHAGCAGPACLHWGLRRGEEYLDPLALVGGGPVRLLPVPGAGAVPREQAGDGAAPAAAVRKAPDGAPPRATAPAARPGLAGPSSAGPRAADRTGPDLVLQAADAPLGLAALAALVAGVALLARPRPRPRPDDPAPAATPAAAAPPPEEPPGPPGELLDLDQARLRRRAAG